MIISFVMIDWIPDQHGWTVRPFLFLDNFLRLGLWFDHNLIDFCEDIPFCYTFSGSIININKRIFQSIGLLWRTGLYLLIAHNVSLVLFLFFDQDQIFLDLFLKVSCNVSLVYLFYRWWLVLAHSRFMLFIFLVDCFNPFFHWSSIDRRSFAFIVNVFRVDNCFNQIGGYFWQTVIIMFLKWSITI